MTKSRFLERIGFTLDAPEVLEAAIRQHAAQGEAAPGGQNVYGESFVLVGELIGPGGSRRVRSVWIRRSGEMVLRFVTLYPAQEKP